MTANVSEQKASGGSPVIVFCGLLAFVISAIIGFGLEPSNAGFFVRSILVIVAVICGTLGGLIGAVIGDILRKIACPSLIITSGGMGSILKEKLFWAIGPQLIGMLIGSVALTMLTAGKLSSNVFVMKDPTNNSSATAAEIERFVKKEELAKINIFILQHKNCSGKAAETLISRVQKEKGDDAIREFAPFVAARNDLQLSTLETFAKLGAADVVNSPRCTPAIELTAVKEALRINNAKNSERDPVLEVWSTKTKSLEVMSLLAAKGYPGVCSNPHATDEILALALEKGADLSGLSLVLKNPHCGPKCLKIAAGRVKPIQVLNLDRPMELGKNHSPRDNAGALSVQLLQHPASDETVLMTLAKRGSASVLLHPKCTKVVVEELAKANCPYVTFSSLVTPEIEQLVDDASIIPKYSRFEQTLLRYAVKGNTNVLSNSAATEKVLLTLAEKTGRGNLDHPNTSAKVVDILARKRPEKWAVIITAPKLSASTLGYIASENKDKALAEAILKHKLMNAQISRAIFKNISDREILKQLATHPLTPVDVLEFLVNSDHYKRQVCNNPNYPVAKLLAAIDWKHLKYSSGNRGMIRAMCARKDVAPKEINDLFTKYLDQKGDEECIKALLSSSHISQENMCRCLVDHRYSQVVAAHPNANTVTLMKLVSESKHVRTLMLAGRRGDAPPELLTKLASHEDSEVRAEAAKNKNTPRETLKALAKDKDVTVRTRAFDTLKTLMTK